MSSGFKITFTAFLPCENRLDALLAGSKTLADVEAALKAAGLVDVKRTDTFVKVQRVKSGPPVVPPTVHPDPQAPAEEAEQAGAASDDDLLSLEGTSLDRSANRRPAA